MRPLATVVVLAALVLAPSSAVAATTGRLGGPLQSPAVVQKGGTPGSTSSTAPVPVPLSDIPPAGRRLSANRVLAIASALPKIRSERAKYRGSFGGAYLKSPLRWQVSFFTHNGKKEIGQVIIDDLSGRVREQWT